MRDGNPARDGSEEGSPGLPQTAGCGAKALLTAPSALQNRGNWHIIAPNPVIVKCPAADFQRGSGNSAMSQTKKYKSRPQAELFAPQPQVAEEAACPAVTLHSPDIPDEKPERGFAESAARHQMILTNIEEGYYEADLSGNFTFCNSSLQGIMGYPHSELMGMNYRQCAVDEESRKKMLEVHNRVFRTGEPIRSFAWEIIRKDGVRRTVEVSASLIRDAEGRPAGFRGVVRDITERMLTESSLRESEEKYRLVVENAREAIIITQDLKLVFANRVATDMIGYSEDVLKSSPFTDFIHSDDRDRVATNHIKRLAGEEVPPVYTFRVVRRDDTIRWVEISAVVVPWKGKPATLNFLNDITERIQAEEALRRNESTLKSIFLASPVGIGLASDRVILQANNRLCEMLGYGREELLGQSARILYLTEEDYEFVGREKYAQLAAKGTGAVETRWVRKDGAILDILLRSSWLEPSNPESDVTFTALDITDRKRAESRLRRSETRYRLLTENIRDIVWTMNLDLKIDYISPSITTQLGYTPEEFMALPWNEILSPRSFDKVMDLYREGSKLIRDYAQEDLNRSLSMNVEHIHKNGSSVWFEITLTLIRGTEEPVAGILGLSRNIDEQMKAEEAKQESMRNLRKSLGATIQAMAVTVETRDPYTAGHQRRVADLARSIAVEMRLSRDQIDGIRMAATIHDLGKISVPVELLTKPTRLTKIEFDLIKTHAQSGYDILKDIDFPWPIARMVLEHHERVDGSGYPNGLTRDQILIESRILSVADVIEAMASHRPYRPGRGIQAALDEIATNRDILYDADAVDACLRLFTEKGYRLVE